MRNWKLEIGNWKRNSLVLWGAVLPVVVQAAPNTPNKLQDLYDATCRAANWFFGFVLLIALVAFLYAAVLFLTSQGNEQKVGQARKVLIYALIGVVLAILSKATVVIIGNFFGDDPSSFFAC